MTVLAFLWWLSIALFAGALIWLATLIIARLFRQKRTRLRLRDRAAVSDACLAVLAGNTDGAHRLAAFSRRTGLMSETILDLVAMLRGADRDRLIGTLSILGVDRRLQARLHKGSLRGRIAAAEALAAFPSPETQAAVGQAYRLAKNPTLRIATLSTLIQLGAPPSPARLLWDIERLQNPDSLIYGAVLRQLTPTARDAMVQALADRGLRPATRAMIADALGASGDYTLVGDLRVAAEAFDPRIREAVVRALGVLGHPDGAPVIQSAFCDRSWEVRAEACVAAGRLGARPFTSHLNIALSDEVWWVRFRAAEALKRAGPLGAATLEVAGRSGDDAVRRSALMALAEQVAA